MDYLVNNDFIASRIEDRVATVRFKNDIFQFLINLDLSNEFADFVEHTENDKNIKALMLIFELGCANEINYGNFLNSIFEKSNDSYEYSQPNFCEKNTRFREINVLNKLIIQFADYNKLLAACTMGNLVTPIIGAFLTGDIVFASEKSKFLFEHNKYGLHPSGALPFFLVQYLGHHKAANILLKDELSSKEAFELGLLTRVFPENDFEIHCLSEVKKLIKVRSCTLKSTKQLLNFSRASLSDYFEYETSLLNL